MSKSKSPVPWLVLLVLSAAGTSALAGLSPVTGYSGQPIFDTEGTFTPVEGLDVRGDDVLVGFGTNVWVLNLADGTTNGVGTLPSAGNNTISFTQYRNNRVHVGYGSYAIPYDYVHGVIDDFGSFESFGLLGGLYDAAVDSSNNLFVVANPGGGGTKVYRFNPASTGLTEVADIGGYSGPIAFDSADRLYVGEQGGMGILRFTPSQLAAGGLTAADGTSVVNVVAGQMCFDEHDRLYVTTGFGAALGMYDVDSGNLVRSIATSGGGSFSIWRSRWDRARKQLVVIDTDFGDFDSTLYTIGFTDSNQGVDGAGPFQGWIANYRDYTRPNTNSGGRARNDTNGVATVWEAIVGKPADFSGGTVSAASGHVLSLGDGASIVLEFDDLIVNGPGPDFAVFENAFYYGGGTFAEFASVEVATTTNAWAKFPATCYVTNPVGLFGVLDATKIDGLAGKHEVEYGTPFDLEWLNSDTNVQSGAVNLDQIAYVRLTDIVGDGSTTDQFGQPIYDPYDAGALPAGTDGFDLRAVGVFHQRGLEAIPDINGIDLQWYGYEGRSYRTASSSDGGLTWHAGGTTTGTGGFIRVSVIVASTSTSRLYRIEQEVTPSP